MRPERPCASAIISGKKPIVLSLVYFDCPALCTEVLNGELRTMNAISLNLGKDFEAVTVSFEPKDTPALAKAKRDVYAGQYGRSGAADHWHFLTGEQQSIDALTRPSVFTTPTILRSASMRTPPPSWCSLRMGASTATFTACSYPARDVRLGLVEASAGQDRNADRSRAACTATSTIP